VKLDFAKLALVSTVGWIDCSARATERHTKTVKGEPITKRRIDVESQALHSLVCLCDFSIVFPLLNHHYLTADPGQSALISICTLGTYNVAN